MSTIVVGFTNSGVPATGLSPTIRIRRTDTMALVVTDDPMAEQGEGAYSFVFAPVDGLEYSIRADGTATLPDAERFAFGSLSGTTEARLETDVPAILVDTDALETRLTAARALLIDQLDVATAGGVAAYVLLIRKIAQNRIGTAGFGTATTIQTVFDDDGTTPLITATLSTENGAPVLTGAGIQVNRTAFS